jgi:hypothetical protein
MTLTDQEELLTALLNIRKDATVKNFDDCVKRFEGRKVAEIHTDAIRLITREKLPR